MNLLSKPFGIFRTNYVWSFGVFEAAKLELGRLPQYRELFFARGGALQKNLEYIHTNADPFLFVRNDILYVFYESVSRSKRGIIKAYSTTDLASFTDLGVILKEDFHLSYPQVLELGDQIYMIPESSAAGKVFLYKFRDFPYAPEIARTLLEGEYVDSSIFLQDGLYYLFTTSPKGLELFVSPDPTKVDFVPHPFSPITSDPRYSRCAGRIIALEGGFYRLAQDCSVHYGRHLNVMRIATIGPSEYREHPVAEGLKFIDEDWLAEGSHHFDWVKFRNRSIVATDGRAPVGLRGKIQSAIGRLKAVSN